MDSKTKNRKTSAQVAQMVTKSLAGASLAHENDAVSELKEGWFNAAYQVRLADGREVILKIAPPANAEVMTYETNLMTTEVHSMRLVAQNPAIPVPAILAFDTDHDVCDSDYFFMEKLGGDNLERIKDALLPEQRAQIDRRIGAIIREVNRFTGATFGYDGNPALRADTWREAFIKIVESVLADGARKQADYGYPVEDIRAALLKHAPALEAVTTPCLVHWDAWDPNFFVQDDEVIGLIDFERALWADPLMEAQFRALTYAGISESMQGYGKTTFTLDERVRCNLYTLHLALVIKTECYYRNYDTDEVSKIGSNLLTLSLKELSAL